MSPTTTNTPTSTRYGVALGSNIEDRLENLREGCRRVCLLHESGPAIRFSSIYETDPVDCEPGTRPYLNAVMEINSTMAPVALLNQLLEIEKAMGRPSNREKNAPRIIDLDLLYADDLMLNNSEVVLPHPRLPGRRFVLAPLAEISPDLILPGLTRCVRGLLADLVDSAKVTRVNVPLFDRG